jgi:hypothetical protein
MTKRLFIPLLLLALTLMAPAQTPKTPQTSSPSPAASTPILPQSFAGWNKVESKLGHDATAYPQGMSRQTDDGEPVPPSARTAAAALYAEEGLLDVEVATYRKDLKLGTGGTPKTEQIFAMRFKDASGAYAALTAYRKPWMRQVKFADLATSPVGMTYFVRGNLFVIAPFEAAEPQSPLKALDAALPRATGSAAALPTLPQYIPANEINAESVNYVLGVHGWHHAALNIDEMIPDSLLGFDFSPEIVTAGLKGREYRGGLLLVSYPTPQIAIKQAQLIEQYGKQHAGDATFAVKREGPLVAVIVGNSLDKENDAVTPAQAQAILGQIHYEAQITGNEATKLAKSDNIGLLVLNACILAGFLALLTIVPGILLGLRGEILDRLMPGRAARRAEEKKLTRLDLK